MNTWRERRRWAGWLALLVIGLAMLAPTVSRALARGPASALPAGWVEVCTPNGVRWVQLDGRGAAQDEGAPDQVALNDCPLCLLAWDRLAPPPAPVAALALRTDLTEAAPPSVAAVMHPARLALAGRPRGPPPGTRFLFVA